MQVMSDDDAAYSALLTELFSDTASTRNARVHSWIEHQYNFALSEQSDLASSRVPSPSPSSSVGAHRNSYLVSSTTPSYDALFFPPPPHFTSDDQDFEERERIRALRFIVQEMARDKPQVVPPSPASSLVQSTESRAFRSPSSSTCVSGFSSVTSTLSSHRQAQEIYPVSVVVQPEYQHDLIHPPIDGDPLGNGKDGPFFYPIHNDKASMTMQLSPTFSSFSHVHSRETPFTTPSASSPTSPTSVGFSPLSPCFPENVALPASPVDDQTFFKEPTLMGQVLERSPSSFQTSLLSSLASLPEPSPRLDVLPASPTSYSSSVLGPIADHAPKLVERSQSRWSATTATCRTPSHAPPPPTPFLDPTTFPEKNGKDSKTPKKRTRFMSLISRFSSGRTNGSSTPTLDQTGDDVECDIVNTSPRQRKSLSKKSSLASLRASFSLSRASFSSPRPAMVSSNEEVPPLPTSPTSPLADHSAPPVPKLTLSKVPSRANMVDTLVSPIPRSASALTTLQSLSQSSIPDISPTSRSGSRLSFVRSDTPNMSRISLLPETSKRASLVSVAGVEPGVSAEPAPVSKAATLSKSIFRLTGKPKSLKIPVTPSTSGTPTPSRLSIDNTSMSSRTTAHTGIPQAPTSFTPPSKLATVIATQTMHVPAKPDAPYMELSDVASKGSEVYDNEKDTSGGLPSLASASAATMCCPRCNCQWFPERTVAIAQCT